MDGCLAHIFGKTFRVTFPNNPLVNWCLSLDITNQVTNEHSRKY